MSQSACVTVANINLISNKLANNSNVLQPSILGQQMNNRTNTMQPLQQQQQQQQQHHFSPLSHPMDQLTKTADSTGFQRAQAGRKSFKRRLQQQHNNLPVRDTQLNHCTPPTLNISKQTNTNNNTSTSPSIGGSGTKNSFGPDPPASVARRNARERNRVKQVNTGFAVLRQHIPVLCGSVIVYGGSPQSDGSSSSSSPGSGGGGGGSNSKKNKMSKVETLRCAVEYIRNLEKLLATGEGSIDLPAIKEEPLDSLSFIQMAVKHQEEENISPDLASTSANDLSGCFYDDSISSGSQSPEMQQQQQQQRFLFDLFANDDDHALPGSANKRIRPQQQESPSSSSVNMANKHQEMMRALSSACWPHPSSAVRNDDVDQHDETDGNSLSDLLLDHGSSSHQTAAGVISDQSLLESINSWWCPNL